MEFLGFLSKILPAFEEKNLNQYGGGSVMVRSCVVLSRTGRLSALKETKNSEVCHRNPPQKMVLNLFEMP